MEHLIAAFSHLFTPVPFLFMLVGVTVGITVGAIPGLSGAMVIALTLPLTFQVGARGDRVLHEARLDVGQVAPDDDGLVLAGAKVDLT